MQCGDKLQCDVVQGGVCQALAGSWELDVSDNGLRTWNLSKTWSTCYSTRCKASMKRRKGREFTEEKLSGIDKGRDKALYSLVGDKDKAKDYKPLFEGLYTYRRVSHNQ